MSKQNETKVLLLALLTTVAIAAAGFLIFKNVFNQENSTAKNESLVISNQSNYSAISAGEKILSPGDATPAKKEGVESIAAGKFDNAVANLEAALKIKKNDPEALIYLNNARIANNKSYTIAASVPIGSDPNTALEILRGIAQAQKEINATGGIGGNLLKVVIGNDEEKEETAKQVAQSLVKNQEVLGVIGPNSSDITLATGKIYEAGKLVAITPVSTSVKITKFSPYVFRTVPSDFIAARALSNYMTTKFQKKNVAVFYNSQSNYSQSLKSEFVSAVSLSAGQVVKEFDLSKGDFSASQSIEQATKQGAEVLMLAANTDTLDKALQVVQVNDKKLSLLGGDDVYALKTLEIAREKAEGMVVAVPWHIEANPLYSFPKQSRELWGADVSWRTASAYDATKALIAALQKNPTRSGIQQALSSPDFSAMGASGAIRFLESGDRNTSVQLVKIEAKKSSRSNTGFDFVPIR
ncbi:MAG: ABC transporter substrate-binding protein [Scytonematopsis contorta HA4267-MV1]|jgi:branched-chain amino acid transport system substrate-binding protein|nr:ABC transporter substrate-binding protein [Scytonematopsis contorta HA4267-MV1]